MITMTLGEIAAVVGGTLSAADPSTPVTGAVEYDSRKVGPGGLFLAFDGASVDGHDFAARAVDQGAAGVLGSRVVEGVPMIVVGDVLAAVGLLARAVLDRLPELTVIGITGSSGKTTTKDLIGQLVARVGPTVAPAGSFNNELGLPHTVLIADEQTRFLVLEMGARGVGHLRYLCEIAPPRIGVVVNVGSAHIGEFGSVEKIALAKGELIEALPPDGLAILNADDPLVAAMAPRTRARVLTVGTSADAGLRATDVTLDEAGRAAYTLDGTVPVRLAVAGGHQVGNSLAAVAVARAVGLPLDECATALGESRLVSSRRMDVFNRADGVTVIDDSYNANPGSTAAALHALAAMATGRRSIAVLGYHAELGDFERSGHEEVGRTAAETGVDLLIVVGSPAAAIHDGAVAQLQWGGEAVLVDDQDAAIEVLRQRLSPGDVILVKGSRYRTWDVVDSLREPVS
ncbi:UDP-N-acetylmuramoyl-tripeptide--D-alanyl-D-alanine ligase [Allocatelliglobosispora scoriae]|uniref:UDP-N-acetylmuramoyl-tripeptide--D-alanyl-D-alanine ligase n=1 Tax=Allocatelliglobosispora scoriae TaxID=643052 RepID=A0A841BRK1_9ACTN|nr:UDP-N-acetylmuramoyl-tripeptide--D-alanyl-D-alanine ligase [Allocatelliglobosispora scoriae]MBB5869372.1 UDP-N-acetylmuramoyl-tripeptide--D-alanyl-D-alanine ligase [Allocatelliglobosispora scoriae]